MDGIISVINHNGIWLMVIAVVAIGGYFKYREHEIRVHRDLRMREMEHQQKMKALEVELEKAKAKQQETAQKV
jgi:predicted negative regulator of RcsB-dependent stress response